VGRVACVRERRDLYRVLVGRPEDLGIAVRMMFKWISKKQAGDLVWFGLFYVHVTVHRN